MVAGDNCHQVWWHGDNPYRLGTGWGQFSGTGSTYGGWGHLSPGLVAQGPPMEVGDMRATRSSAQGPPI